MLLLSVDFDYFFPVPAPEKDDECLYDWGSREDVPFMKEGIWNMRAGQLLAAGKPLPQTSGLEKTFWSRFKFAPGATLFYADSHVQIYSPRVREGVQAVTSFDAHHDAYESFAELKKTGKVSCENWATAYAFAGVPVFVFYPAWRWGNSKPKATKFIFATGDAGSNLSMPFDRIFLCRSGAWVPSWVDEPFFKFLESCPAQVKVNLDGMSRREMDWEIVEKTKEGVRLMLGDQR